MSSYFYVKINLIQGIMTTNKIFMTYKKNIPELVTKRWNQLNLNYEIEFSLDVDCIKFLNENSNKYVADLFVSIKNGMYKADLWRLCKLYVNGGVYADVDLVPYLDIDKLDKEITFYTCMSTTPEYNIFQAFMVNFSKPKHPLMFVFLLSFLVNNPYNYNHGPCYDMYNCIKYMLPNINIIPGEKYEIDEVKIKISVGPSDENIKKINLYYFPNEIQHSIYLVSNPYQDCFRFEIKNNILFVTRLDTNTGWKYSHFVDICFHSKASIYLFKENIGLDNNWVTSYVTHNNKKILDSRDLQYYFNAGW